MPAANRFMLDAVLSQRDGVRHTPAGIPAVECTLTHHSSQREAGFERAVDCEMHAIAFGPVAKALCETTIGTTLRCEGFIARRYRTGPSVTLHLTRFDQNETTRGI